MARVSRLELSLKHPRFLSRIFVPEEAAAFLRSPPDTSALACAFALKEALLKALGTGWSQGVAFLEIAGPPAAPTGTLRLSGRCLELAQSLGVTTIQASACRHGDLVLGSVILRREEGRPLVHEETSRTG